MTDYVLPAGTKVDVLKVLEAKSNDVCHYGVVDGQLLDTAAAEIKSLRRFQAAARNIHPTIDDEIAAIYP